jgi:hypothetical protein
MIPDPAGPAAAFPGSRAQADVNLAEEILVGGVVVVVETEVHSPALLADVAGGLVSRSNVMYKLRAEIKIEEEIVLALEIDAAMAGDYRASGEFEAFEAACPL